MKIKSRALTRHYLARAKCRGLQAAKFIFRRDGSVTEEIVKRNAIQRRDTPCGCSCHMCRNPRTSTWTKGKLRKTIQERKAELENFQQIAA